MTWQRTDVNWKIHVPCMKEEQGSEVKIKPNIEIDMNRAFPYICISQ